MANKAAEENRKETAKPATKRAASGQSRSDGKNRDDRQRKENGGRRSDR